MTKIARILIACMFILSAMAKLLSLPFFDQMVSEFFLGKVYYEHITGMFFSQVFSRVLIAGELILGVAILQNRLLKKVVLPAIMLMLTIFTSHLFYMGFKHGFVGSNCGCFGDVIPFNNLESIIKNIIAMMLVAYVYFNHFDLEEFNTSLAPILLGIVTLFVTMITPIKQYSSLRNIETPLTPIITIPNHTDSTTSIVDTSLIIKKDSNVVINQKDSSIKPKTTIDSIEIAKRKITQDSLSKVKLNQEKITRIEKKSKMYDLLDQYTKFEGKKRVNLNRGHKLICLYSLTCSHCQASYKDLYAMKEDLPDMYLLCYGQEFDKFYFFTQAGGEQPHLLLNSKQEFDILMGGKSFPRILEMKNGKILKEWDMASYSKESVAKRFNVDLSNQKTNEDNNSGIDDSDNGGGFNPFK